MKIKIMLIIYLLLSTKCQYYQMDKSMEAGLRPYITLSKQGVLIQHGQKFKKFENPKVSIIIPMYNEAKNALGSIRSIQNQSLLDLEIVCVNDNSNDNTLSVLTELQKEDPRITILNNKSNRGVIYSRIFGALKSKGEYVTFIDADDGLCNMKILETSYAIATQNKNERIDIVHYQTCGAVVDKNGEMGNFLLLTIFNPKKFNQIIRQPYISDNYMQRANDVTGSGFVFDKIFSKELIKRTADYIGPEYWNQNLIFSDDFLLCYGAMRMAKNIVNIGEIGYWHNFDTVTSTTSNVWNLDGDRLLNPEKSNKKILDFIIVTERIMELTEDEPQFAQFRESNMRKLGDAPYIKSVARSAYYDRYMNICAEFINWKYISKEMREKNIKFLEYLISYDVGIRNKLGLVLDEDVYDFDEEGKKDNTDYNDDDNNDDVNDGVDDL